jgi:probable HAF family extracellular repeat protein
MISIITLTWITTARRLCKPINLLINPHDGVSMNTPLVKLKRIAILLSGISAASIPVMAHADWTITALGTLGGPFSGAGSINDSGQVAGTSITAAGEQHAFITGPNGIGMTDLGTLGGPESYATGINDFGQVVGTSITADGFTHAFTTGPNGTDMTDLGTLTPHDINDSGQVVGISFNADGTNHFFITGPNGIGMTELSSSLGGTITQASDINDSGQVVGTSITADGFAHPFITGPKEALIKSQKLVKYAVDCNRCKGVH